MIPVHRSANGELKSVNGKMKIVKKKFIEQKKLEKK